MQTKDFPTLAVLTVTSGRLLTIPRDPDEGNGIGQVYEVLGWMTDDSPFTHQLGRFAEECRPWIHRWYPSIIEADAEIVRRCEAGEVAEVQRDMLARFSATIALPRIPQDDHERKHPYDELVAMRGTDEGIVVV
jgi:hypothetical protein